MSEKLEKAARGRRELMKNAVAAYAGKNSVLLHGEKSYISEDSKVCPYEKDSLHMIPLDFFLKTIGKENERTSFETSEEKDGVLYASLEELCKIYGKFLHTEINGLMIYSDDDIEKELDWQRNTDVMRNICESFMFEDISGKEIAALIEKNHPDHHHPRLLFSQEKIDFIKGELSKENGDKVYKKIFENIITYADKFMTENSSGYEIRDGIRLLYVCRENGERMILCALAYLLTGEEKYAKRAYLEMYNCACFINWNPYHFLDVGEMCASLGMCYDWLYNWMDENERLYIRRAIFQKGIMQIIDDFDDKERKRSWNWRGDLADNWCLVISGVGLSAMSIFDELSEEERPYAERAMEQTLLDMRRALSLFAPYGGYEEGFNYWGYAMEYFTQTIESLKNAAGSYFGYVDVVGMKLTNKFMMAVNGSVSVFSYHDCARPGSDYPPQMMFLAKYFNTLHEAKPRIEMILNGGLPGEGHDVYSDLFWYDPKMLDAGNSSEVKDVFLPISEIATMRSGWTKDDMFVGFHCDNPLGDGKGHSHMDVGTFVMDAFGETFFIDLGADNYNVSDYYNTYRVRAEGHNVLVFNADERHGQKKGGIGGIEKYEFGENESFAIGNLSDVYDDDIGIETYKRGVKIGEGKTEVSVQDEVKLNKKASVWWFAHTEADVAISPDGKSAILTKGTKKLKATLNCNADAKFTVMDAKLLPKSPVIKDQEPNDGVRKLSMYLEEIEELNLCVTFSSPEAEKRDFVPMENWCSK
ncbi:MAG: hypothetical protein E7394_03060 [Ruminococcaceae bacterium]|nr:hypothetical protein [Oscillospiraceae bacterium]